MIHFESYWGALIYNNILFIIIVQFSKNLGDFFVAKSILMILFFYQKILNNIYSDCISNWRKPHPALRAPSPDQKSAG
jgi:hypothetical protein